MKLIVLAALLTYLREIDPDHPVLAPGERGWNARRDYERDGVPLHPDIVRQLQEVGVVLQTTRS